MLETRRLNGAKDEHVVAYASDRTNCRAAKHGVSDKNGHTGRQTFDVRAGPPPLLPFVFRLWPGSGSPRLWPGAAFYRASDGGSKLDKTFLRTALQD